MKKVKIEAKVVGKFIEESFFGLSKQPMLSIYSKKMTPQFSDIPVGSMAEYFSLKVGSIIYISFWKKENGNLEMVYRN